MNDEPLSIALVLGGGNALGSYQAGVYQALHEREIEPNWLVGASAGAINGALIVGNPREQRMERLTEFWRPAPENLSGAEWHASFADDARRTGAVLWTLASGRPDVFAPRHPFARWWDPISPEAPSSLFDSHPLARTLARLVDFERLNASSIRYCATAVDLESGEDVVFDTRSESVAVDHVRGSAALLPALPPVEVDGRMVVDAGMSANLPLDVVLRDPPPGRTLCLAIDLLPLSAPIPRGLGEVASRLQDLMFAAQSRRTIQGWQRLYDLRQETRGSETPEQPAVTLVHLAYADQQDEVAGKAFDFSPESVRERWSSGYRDMRAVLDRLEAGSIPLGQPGLTVVAGH